MITLEEILRSERSYDSDRMTARFMCLGHAVAVAKRMDKPGYWMEFGVHSGETINFISHRMPEKMIYGFDSFKGLPEDWIHGFPKGTFNMNGELPEVRQNVELVVGLFEQALPKFLFSRKIVDSIYGEEKVAFLHIDSDLYSSAKYVLHTLRDRIGSGTVIVFDEMINIPEYEKHEFRAFNEFLEKSELKAHVLCHTNYEQVAFVII